jgi:manganese/zinc/iron transport system permease protein
MSQPQIEIQLIAAVVSAACALPGVFLVLRRMALLSDAISHSILLGIVLAFFVVQNLYSPLLVFGAAIMGVITVSLVELLERSRLVKSDAAIGLVFPLLFSFGIILISRYAGDVHLDTDAVLMGELAYTPFTRFAPFGTDLGPLTLYVMGGILILNIVAIAVFYKELKIATFDPALAASLGISPTVIHYGLMSLVSITTVGAFDAVGSILVVALMIAPPATAYLLTDRLSVMLVLSVIAGVISAVAGFWLATALDASIGGSMAAMTGTVFFLAFLFSPSRGIIAGARRRIRQRWHFAQTMLAIHLAHHEGRPEAAVECREDHLQDHLRWDREYSEKIVLRSQRDGYVINENGLLLLTEKGRSLAREAIIA